MAASTSTVEAKKHLAGVRVIQRNLVYIIGLPAYLCNESVSTVSLFITRLDTSKLCDMFKFQFSYQYYYYFLFQVLERREYFGQYGKVLKVSVSRPTGPPSQQASANNNISVYASLNLMLYMHDLFLLHMQRHYLGFVNQFDISNRYPPLYTLACFKFVCFLVILEHQYYKKVNRDFNCIWRFNTELGEKMTIISIFILRSDRLSSVTCLWPPDLCSHTLKATLVSSWPT